MSLIVRSGHGLAYKFMSPDFEIGVRYSRVFSLEGDRFVLWNRNPESGFSFRPPTTPKRRKILTRVCVVELMEKPRDLKALRRFLREDGLALADFWMGVSTLETQGEALLASGLSRTYTGSISWILPGDPRYNVRLNDVDLISCEVQSESVVGVPRISMSKEQTSRLTRIDLLRNQPPRFLVEWSEARRILETSHGKFARPGR